MAVPGLHAALARAAGTNREGPRASRSPKQFQQRCDDFSV